MSGFAVPRVWTSDCILEFGCLALGGLGPLVFLPWANDGFELPKQTFMRLTIAVSLFVAVALVLDLTRLVGLARRTRPIAVLLLVLTVSTLTSVAPGVSLWGTYQRWAGLFTQVNYLLVFLVAALAIRSDRQAIRLCAVLAVGASIVALYAIAQQLGLDFVTWSQGVVWGWQPVSGRERPFSTLGNPDFLGAFLALTIFTTVGGALRAVRSGPWWFASALQIVALVLSQCRSAWIGLVVGGVLLPPLVAVARAKPWRTRAIRSAGAVLAAVLVLLILRALIPESALLGRAGSIADPTGGTASVRLLLWRASLPLILEHPVLGSGLDTFGTVIVDAYPTELWRLEQPEFPVDRAHNALLETLVTQGVLGLLAMMGVAFAVGRAGASLVRRGNVLVGCVGVALIAHVVEQQLNVEVTAASMLAWLMAGAIVGLAEPRASRGTKPLPAGARAPRLFVALALSAGVGWWLVQPLRADWTYAVGLAAERLANGQMAQDALVATTNAWPVEPTYWNELARVRTELGRVGQGPVSVQAYRGAVDAADRALALNPSSTQLISNWGLIAAEAAVRSGDAALGDRAAATADEAITRAPRYWLFWRSAGATAFNLGDYATAEARFMRAADLYAVDVTTWAAMGDAAVQAHDLSTAYAAYRRTLDLEPGNQHARNGLARLAME